MRRSTTTGNGIDVGLLFARSDVVVGSKRAEVERAAWHMYRTPHRNGPYNTAFAGLVLDWLPLHIRGLFAAIFIARKIFFPRRQGRLLLFLVGSGEHISGPSILLRSMNLFSTLALVHLVLDVCSFRSARHIDPWKTQLVEPSGAPLQSDRQWRYGAEIGLGLEATDKPTI